MALVSLWKRVRLGVWSGLFGALALIAFSLVLRWATGVGTLPELLGDRVAPLLGIPIFFWMIGFFGGYVHLKEFGIVSILLNELVAGLLFGLLYLWLQRSAPAKARTRLVGAVALAFALVIAFLWGNLSTNYYGVPPTMARLASLAGLALSAAVFAMAILWWNRVLGAEPQASNPQRRAVLVGGASSVLTLLSVSLLAYFYRVSTYSYDGKVNAGPDLPTVTPNDDFYSVTKNNVDPDPTTAVWGLEVHGHVQTPLKLHLGDLRGMPQITQQTTLQCISNPTGGTLSSNGAWTGVALSELLGRAGASEKAQQVMLHGADGFVDAIPIDAARHPYTLVVHQMNGGDLPPHHGYPVRLIVPGYVGEKSVKWLTGIEVREVPGEGFYERQGWGPHFAIENASRFDAPEGDDDVKVNEQVELKGTAFAGDRGVRAVQVSTDGGDTWVTADLTYPGTQLTWAQWHYLWTPKEAGDLTLSVRCIDGLGSIQSGEKRFPGPGQASGYHELNLTVKA